MKPIYYTNHLKKLLKKYKNKYWYWKDVMKNPNMTFDVIHELTYLPVSMGELCKVPDIQITKTADSIRISKIPCNHNNDYYYEDNSQWWPNHEWCSDVSLELDQEYKDTFENGKLIIDGVCVQFSNRIDEIIKEFLNNKVDVSHNDFWWLLSYNQNLKTKTVESNINKPWNISALSKNPNITWGFVQQYPTLPWAWNDILYTKNWDWESLKNVIPRIEKIDNIWPNFWSMLSCHHKITWDIIKNNPDYPWDWSYISCNPNLTYDIIDSEGECLWNWVVLSGNKFEMHKEIKRRHCKNNARYYLDNLLYNDIIDIILVYL